MMLCQKNISIAWSFLSAHSPFPCSFPLLIQ